MTTPSPYTIRTRDPRVRSVTESGKSNLGRLAVRLLAGDAKTLAVAAGATHSTNDIDIPADTKRVSRPPVRGSRLSAVTRIAAAADAQIESGAVPSKPAPVAEVSPGWRSSRRHGAQRAVVARRRPSKPTATSISSTSDTALESPSIRTCSSIESSNSSGGGAGSSLMWEMPSLDDPMGKYLAIMEQFVEEPAELESLRAAEAARRNRKGSAGADSAKPSAGGDGRSHEFARQNTHQNKFTRQRTLSQPCVKEFLSSAGQAPGTRSPSPGQHHHHRHKSLGCRFSAEQFRAGAAMDLLEINRAVQSNQRAVSSSPSPPPLPQQHHTRWHNQADDVLESATPVTGRGRTIRPSQSCKLPRETSHSPTDRVTTVEQAEQAWLGISAAPDCRPSAVTVSRSDSSTVGVGGSNGATSASREQQRQEQRQRWAVQACEISQKRELELLVDALKAELRVKDELLENECRLHEGELLGAWEHVAYLERQLEGMQAAGAAMEREIDALRAEASLRKRSFTRQRRGGNEEDTSVAGGNRFLEMEWAVRELTRKLAGMGNELQRSEAQIAELIGMMYNRENELGQTKSALQRAESERDSLAEEMEAAFSSLAADSSEFPPAVVLSSPEVGDFDQETANLASALEAAKRELHVAKTQRDLVLMAVGQPKRHDQLSQQRSSNLTLNRSLTPFPAHSPSPSLSSCSRSGPMELLRGDTIAAPHVAAHRRSRHRRRFPLHPTDVN